MNLKTFFAACLLLSLTLPATARNLRGEVTLRNADGEATPVANAVISLKETGDSTRSKTGGEFRLFLPAKPRFAPGCRVTLKVDKDGSCVLHPYDGTVLLPADEYKIIPVRLLPSGEGLQSESCIEKLIADIAEKSKEQITHHGESEDIDFSRYIKDWAVQYGFSAEQAKAEIDQWVAEVQAHQDDFYKLGLAAYAEKNFPKAARLFIESAESKHARRLKTEAEAQRLREEEVRDFRKAGESWSNAYEFDKALQAYENALAAVERETEPALWAVVKLEVGDAHYQIAVHAKGQAAHHHLIEALKTILEMVAGCSSPRGNSAVNCVFSLNSFGKVLSRMNTQLGYKASPHMAAASVEAHRATLKIYTRERWPQKWALTQHYLGAKLREQGELTEGEAGLKLLADAVTACRNALEVRTREHFPQDWAATQNHLANALRAQAARVEGEASLVLLVEAEAAIHAALEVFSHEQFPKDWAKTQNNLGNMLYSQGIRMEGEAGLILLAKAEAAFRATLKVNTRENLPQDWASAHHNLGVALKKQSERTKSEEKFSLLTEAVASFRAALEVRTQEHLPQQWAQTHRRLALAYVALENWQDATESFALLCKADLNGIQTCAATRWLYHEKLFDYAKAFALSEQWLKDHPDDQDAQLEFAEQHLTTGRFAEARVRLEGLLAGSLQQAQGKKGTRIGLMLLDIAATAGMGETAMVANKKQALAEYLASLEHQEIEGGWGFAGTRHFLAGHPAFTEYGWLDTTMGKVEEQDWAGLAAVVAGQ
ncbi:MAG: hypothetical protein GY862_06240 [Gammaproteobacteria bacterium]|nr:hypothetical protein [Gammaproteobacteria bacterium]